MTLEALVILWLLGAGLLVVVVVVSWGRVGHLRDTLDEVRDLVKHAQGVNLLHEVRGLRGELERLEPRLELLERERTTDRKELIETNQQVLRAMDGLREAWTQQTSIIATRVAADVRAIYDSDVRRLVRDEYHKLKAGSSG